MHGGVGLTFNGGIMGWAERSNPKSTWNIKRNSALPTPPPDVQYFVNTDYLKQSTPKPTLREKIWRLLARPFHAQDS